MKTKRWTPKKGETVRIRKDVKPGGFVFDDNVKKYAGKTATALGGFDGSGDIFLDMGSGCNLWWRGRDIEPVVSTPGDPDKTRKVVITVDGLTTKAMLFEGSPQRMVRKAEANCNPHDTYDFKVGAKLALDRLLGVEEKAEEPALYNGTVLCVSNEDNPKSYTTGKLYRFHDGNIVDDLGNVFPGVRSTIIRSFQDWEKWSGSKWIEVKEEPAKREERTALYDGLVCCISNEGNPTAYTAGKLYRFEGGRVRDDHKILRPAGDPIHSFPDWQKFAHAYGWIEVKEE